MPTVAAAGEGCASKHCPLRGLTPAYCLTCAVGCPPDWLYCACHVSDCSAPLAGAVTPLQGHLSKTAQSAFSESWIGLGNGMGWETFPLERNGLGNVPIRKEWAGKRSHSELCSSDCLHAAALCTCICASSRPRLHHAAAAAAAAVRPHPHTTAHPYRAYARVWYNEQGVLDDDTMVARTCQGRCAGGGCRLTNRDLDGCLPSRPLE